MPNISIVTPPDQVLMRYYEAMNSGDINSALALFDADAIRLDTATPNTRIKGREQISAGIRARIADHISVTATDYQVKGETVTCSAAVSTDYARRLGFAPVEEEVEVTVKNGLIVRFVVIVTPESLERIRVAEAN